jgi:nucleotide-binding universal stress UspA family protein
LLIANDGSDGAEKAFAAALELANRLKAELHMICVEELPRFPISVDEVIEERNEAGRLFRGLIRRARARTRARGVEFEAHIIAGHAVPGIVEFVEKGGFDLLVIGYMGHSALYNRLIGGATDRLVELAACQVLVVK